LLRRTRSVCCLLIHQAPDTACSAAWCTPQPLHEAPLLQRYRMADLTPCQMSVQQPCDVVCA
jgi:hypothetical protein